MSYGQQLDWTREEYHRPDWQVVMPGTNQEQRVCRICGMFWGDGYQSSHGTAGARGRLTHVSETLDQALTGASTTPDDGLNTFQGELRDISLRSKEGPGAEFILTVFYDSRTASRLAARVYGPPGRRATEGAGSLVMIQTLEPAIT